MEEDIEEEALEEEAVVGFRYRCRMFD